MQWKIAKGMEATDKKSHQFKSATDGIVNKLTGYPLHSTASVAVNKIIRLPAVISKMPLVTAVVRRDIF